jgi:acetyl esterase
MFAEMPRADYATITAAQLREMNDRPMAFGEPIAMARTQDVELVLPLRNLPARLYVPEGAGENPPLVIYYHGGGWVIGTIETHDGTCRALARASGAAVLSVGYRLAPEHPYPAPVEDCYDALVWTSRHAGDLGCDHTRLAVAGDSAGGNLSAAVAIMARDRSGPALRHQLLIYPVTDDDYSLPSYAENGGGEYFLGEAMMRWFWEQYLGDAEAAAKAAAAVANQGKA